MRANTLRKGHIILHNNQPWRVIAFNHLTPGNLRAMVQVKLRNLLSGIQTDTRYGATEDVPIADVYYAKATYLYHDAAGYHFMDSESYEEHTISPELLDDSVYYLQDNMEVEITNYNGAPIGVELPATVTLTVVETEPEMRGATASNSPKPAKTNTGLMLSVPTFIKEGEKISVNTEDGKYVGRADE